MNCKHVLQRMLATTGSRKLSPEVLTHLDGCQRCQRWHARLGAIDRAVPLIPVPNSHAAKTAFVQRLLAEPSNATTPSSRNRISTVTWKRVAATAISLAALVFAIAFIREALPPTISKSAEPPDEFLAEVLDHGMILATAATPQKRVEELATLADRLDQRTRRVARVASADDLNEMARLYEMVVGGDKGLVARAGKFEGDKAKVLNPIADRLLRSSQDVESMSREVPPSAMESLKKIAAVAREANQKLRGIVQENPVASGGSGIGEGKS